MASAIQTYLEAGGKVYLEGGDALGYDQSANTSIHNLFGLTSASDGTTNIIDGLAGQSDAITNGMLFTSSTQVSNTYIDIISPSTGAVSFIESGYGNVAVQNVGSYGQKTFCFSYALSQLVDGASPSTKNDLLAGITNFLLSAVPSFVNLNQPNGNEIWKVGSTKKNVWGNYSVDNVRLEYTSDNGTNWIEIIASTPASTGEYDWTIPNTPSDQCKVKISDVLNSAVFDESNNLFAIVPLYFTHTIETFDNAVGNFFPDPPVANQNFWTNGPTAYLNLTDDAEHIEGTGSTRVDYRVEAYDDWGGYVVRSTYNHANTSQLPYIDLSAGDHLKLWYKILSPVSLSQTGTVYFEFKLAEYNESGQRDLWLHRTSINLSDLSGNWIEVSMPLQQTDNSDLGFAPQFINGDGILQLDKIKGFEVAIVCSTAGGPVNSPTAIGTFLIDNLQLAYTGILSLLSPNGGEIWKVGQNHDIKWNSNDIDNIDLTYSTDNGSFWNPIASSQPASSGKYIWTIPNAVSSQCKVKISKAGNGVGDESNGLFEIKAAGVTAEVEPNNTADIAMNVGIIDEIEGTISPENDVDYFKFTAMAGDVVQIYGEARNSSDLYGLIMLFDQNGNQLSSNTYFNNTPTKQRIVYQLPNSGIYYVRYTNQNNWGGYPNIAIKDKDTDNETEKVSEAAESTQQANAPLAYSGDYRLTIGYFTPSEPIIINTYTNPITYNSVVFRGSLYPNGIPTQVAYEYGVTTSYGNTILPNPALYDGYYEVSANPVKATGLQPNSLYHFHMVAVNSEGIESSVDQTFTTPAEPEGWVFQESGLTNENISLRGVYFIDENNGYAVGDRFILKTTNAGTNWTHQEISVGSSLRDICFATTNIGIAVGWNGTIARTTDGGTTWSSQEGVITNNFLLKNCFGDANVGYAVGYNGTILKTTDAGASWNVLGNSPTTEHLRGVYFSDANKGTIVGYNGVILNTTDGGSNWSMQTLPSGRSLYALHFSDANNGCAVGNGDEAYHTTDGGATWNAENLGNWYNLYGVFFTDANNGTAVGSGGIILKTVNGGNSWTQINSGTTQWLFDIFYNVKGTIVGDYATILRSVDYLSLNSPNGGEIWKVGSSYDIKWNNSGVDNIDLAYSTDNGTNWTNIVTNQPASSGKYTWTIPNAVSTQCKVKITKTGNGVGDESNGVFEIKAAGVTAEVEPNNTANDAMNVGIIDEIYGTISPQNDIDYFKFTGSAGDVVQIYGEERNGSGLYGLIMLFDQNGNQLYNNSYFMNTPTKQRIVYELPNSGVYYIRYTNWNNWGSYPNIAVKGDGQVDDKNRLKKLNKGTQEVNAPLALSGDYRLTIAYFIPSAPLIGYIYATDVNYNSTRFSGQIYPNGLNTSVTIEYGLTSSYGNSFVAVTNVNSLNEWYFTSDKLSGLQANTFYHYRAVAQNSAGTTTGDDHTFSTPSEPVNWVHQNSNTTNSLRGVDFIDQNNGFVAGYGNTILKTTDGGTTWTNVCPQIGFDANCVEVINVNKIVAAGNSMLISEDGGSTWSQQQVGNYWLNGISFADVNNGIVVNANGEIYKTTDGGISWALLTDPISTSLLTVHMLDANTIFAVSSDGQVIKSTDGGLNWASQLLGNWCCSWWAGIAFADMNNGMIASMNTFLIYKTTDGGNTWTTLNHPNNFPVVSMIDANNALAAGFSIIRTQNGGTTWTEEETGSANLLFGIKALSYGEVWAVGEWGTILHSEICEPGWSPVQNQQYNMNIIAELYFDDQLSLNEQDIVGAFVGNECRGVASPNASLNGKIFLTVSSNVQSGEDIIFKAWKSDNCEESLILETMAFQSQGEVGTINNPFAFRAGAVEVAYNFGTGYTWFSVNANPGNWNVNTIFNGLNPVDNDRIIGQTNFAVYYAAGSQWIGSLTTIDPKKMYIMKLTNGQTFNLKGLPVDPQTNPISLGAGYTWLGYLPSSSNPINSSLLNMSPGPSDNDRLIGQTNFAVYYAAGNQWIGSLANMEPAKGYKIKVTNSSTLTYPSNNTLLMNQTKKLAEIQSPPSWTPVQNQQYNMSIIGEIVWDGQVSTSSNDIIGAFVGTECRGIASPLGTPPFSNLFFLTVTSNQSSGEEVTLKVYHAGLDQVDENPDYPNYPVTFADQSALGTISNPFTVTSPLPVELTSFTANVNSDKVNLNWGTATEVNNYGFEIERASSSTTPIQGWKKIGFVQGNGNSNSPKIYNFTDNKLIGGTKFQYRLKQIDADGKFSYSDVVEVEVIPTEYTLYQNYPNPFNPTTTIRYSLPKASKVTIKIYDLIGNEVGTLVNEEKPIGNFEVEFSGEKLSTGIYLFKLQAGDYTSIKKMMLLK